MRLEYCMLLISIARHTQAVININSGIHNFFYHLESIIPSYRTKSRFVESVNQKNDG